MRKTIVAVATFLLVAGMAFGAYGIGVFDDLKISVGNVLAAGTLELEVTPLNENEDGPASYEFTNLKPGDKGEWKDRGGFHWMVKNVGSLDAVVTVSIVEPAEGWGLGNLIWVEARVDGVRKDDKGHTLSTLPPFSFELGAGESAEVHIGWGFPACDNEWQGQEVHFDVEFAASQK